MESQMTPNSQKKKKNSEKEEQGRKLTFPDFKTTTKLQ